MVDKVDAAVDCTTDGADVLYDETWCCNLLNLLLVVVIACCIPEDVPEESV